jgi:pimeloyl-ACP methyl ester carboxylesterase
MTFREDIPSVSRRRVSGWALCALFGLVSTLGAQATAAVATVEPVSPCFVAPPEDLASAFKYDCGYVVVPEDVSAPDGRKVKLGFLRLQARTPKKASPLFVLAGGPGSSMIEPAVFSLFNPRLLGSLLDSRDVVVLDQRGARHTRPDLTCAALDSLPWRTYSQGLSEEASDALERHTLERCIQELRQQGIELSKYNSLAIAADVDAARAALGYDKIVYYGASYGSQLGQHVMRDFPAMLEAVILDGTNSLSRKSWIEDRAQDADYALEHLTAMCQSDPKCRDTYDIPALIARGLAIFDAGPIAATYDDPKQTGTTLKFDVRQSDFVSLVYELQTSKYGAASLPLVLTGLVEDGRTSMGRDMGNILGQKLLAARDATPGAMVTLMHMAVVCSDDPVRSVSELVLDGVHSRYAALFGKQVATQYVRLCAVAGVPELPPATDNDVTAAVPTLILSGGLDAQTPTFRSEVVARSLPRARMVVFADGTHVQVAGANLCAARIVASFVRDPNGALPLKCVDDMRFPGFVMPGE